MVWGKGPQSSFRLWKPKGPGSVCWEDCPFSTGLSWHLGWTSVVRVCSWIRSPDLCGCVWAEPQSSFCNLVVLLEPGKWESPCFVLFQDNFGNSGSLEFPCEFWDLLVSFCQKQNKNSSFDFYCVESVDQFGGCCHLNTVPTSDPWTWGVFPLPPSLWMPFDNGLQCSEYMVHFFHQIYFLSNLFF